MRRTFHKPTPEEKAAIDALRAAIAGMPKNLWMAVYTGELLVCRDGKSGGDSQMVAVIKSNRLEY